MQVPALPATVTTDRLVLGLFSAEEVAAVRSGARRSGWHEDFPREDDADGVGMWVEGDPWGSRSVVADGLTIGSIGFFGPPEASDDGVLEAEIGYGLVEAARGRGIVTEALEALLALTDTAGVRVRASVLPDNQPSLRVLAKTGFTQLRGTSEDGELVMARPLR